MEKPMGTHDLFPASMIIQNKVYLVTTSSSSSSTEIQNDEHLPCGAGGIDEAHFQLYGYKNVQKLHVGPYSEVYLVRSLHDEMLYVVKAGGLPTEVADDHNALQGHPIVLCGPSNIVKEAKIHGKLNHTNVVKLFSTVKDEKSRILLLVLEHMSRGSLQEQVGDVPLSESRAHRFFTDALEGLDYVHQQKVIHRDIKPGNMLLTGDDRLKISDFGLSEEFEGEDAQLTGTLGTPVFIAPECVQEPGITYLGKPVDIWSLGMTLFYLLHGQTYFLGRDKYQVFEAVRTTPVVINNSISENARSLLSRMLEVCPEKRITCEELWNHPWVVQKPTKNREQN